MTFIILCFCFYLIFDCFRDYKIERELATIKKDLIKKSDGESK